MLTFPKKLLKRAVFLLVVILILSRWIREVHDERVKWSPIDFSSLRSRADLTSWSPDVPIRYSNGTHIDDRYRKVHSLTDGKEGHVNLYVDMIGGGNVSVVVKTISTPSRNDIPSALLSMFGSIASSWPSEIEATLALGARTIKGHSYVVPVYDYFILEDTTSSPSRCSWALVTELVSGGTLLDLAGDLSQTSQTAEQIDAVYHGSLDKLLSSLNSLHEDGYCHDDVKPANIFVSSPRNWLLGDLGNLRDVKHAYHQVGDWSRRNQLADCRANDLERAMKSYMNFLRAASRNQAEFDWMFLSGKESWSKLYWCSKQDRRCLARTDALSEQSMPGKDISESPKYVGSYIGDQIRRSRVELELQWNLPWWRVLLKS